MIYAYVEMAITNPESLGKYREVAEGALQKHGGAVVTAGKENTLIDGDKAVPDAVAIISFPDKDSAMNWINDPELADIHNLRRNSGNVSIILVG